MEQLPRDAVDTHMHFYDARYPPAATTVLRPPDATPRQYGEFQDVIGARRVVVVQPTTYGLDNSCQLDAMEALRRRSQRDTNEDTVRGIAVVDADTTDGELRRLHGLGVRGARFHMLPGGAVPWAHLAPVAERIGELGWHIQLQLNGRELPAREQELSELPTPLVIDHVGRFTPPVSAEDEAFLVLQRLLASGQTWVKISAPYESKGEGYPHYRDVAVLARSLIADFPHRMLWASNWPHPGQTNPPTPTDLLGLFADWFPSDVQQAVLIDNPAELYDFE